MQACMETQEQVFMQDYHNHRRSHCMALEQSVQDNSHDYKVTRAGEPALTGGILNSFFSMQTVIPVAASNSAATIKMTVKAAVPILAYTVTGPSC